MELTGRMLEIVTLGGGLPLEKVAAYREQFRRSGYEVPDWQGGPGLIEKATNFAKAVVKDVAAGSPRVSDEVFASRLAICRECGLYNARAVTCGHPTCGCQLKVKARWGSMECPIGRWGKQS